GGHGERARDRALGPVGAERLRQRLRWDHGLRRRRAWDRHRPRHAQGARRGREQAARGAAGRQQCRRGPADPRLGRQPARGTGRHNGRCRAARGRARGGGSLIGMAIWLNKDSKVIVQGMTGSEGSKHTRRMLRAGTNIVGGVTPGKGGQKVDFDGTTVPVFNSVAEAMAETGADTTVIFVPPRFAKGAVVEAIDARISLAVVITEGIPVHDTAAFWAHNVASGQPTRIIGPNCPGIASPGQSNAGPIPADITGGRRIGLVSKSGTLTYQ